MSENQVRFGTRFPEIFAALGAPFHPDEVKTRTQGGRQLSYITARTAMNRLDDVLGPENWSFDVDKFGDHSIICRMTIVLPDGTTVTKADVGANSRMAERSDAADPGDDDKGGASDGLKRVAVLFGVGRYLYRDGVPGFVHDHSHGHEAAELTVYPRHQEPRSEAPRRSQDSRPHPNGNGNGNGPSQDRGTPQTGKQLFAWCMRLKQERGMDVLGTLNDWAKAHKLSGRMVDWKPDAVAAAYEEGCRIVSMQGRD